MLVRVIVEGLSGCRVLFGEGCPGFLFFSLTPIWLANSLFAGACVCVCVCARSLPALGARLYIGDESHQHKPGGIAQEGEIHIHGLSVKLRQLNQYHLMVAAAELGGRLGAPRGAGRCAAEHNLRDAVHLPAAAWHMEPDHSKFKHV